MVTYYPYAKPNYVKKNGHTPVYIRFNYNRVKRTLIPVNVDVKPKHWDFKNHKLKRACPEHEDKLEKIQSMQNRVGNIVDYARANQIDPTIEFVVDALNKNIQYDLKQQQVDFFEQLDQFIESKKGKVSNDTIKDYYSLKKHLKGFQDNSKSKIYFRNLNYSFYNQFVDYLTYHAKKPDETVGLRTNSVGKQIKNLKIFLRDRMKQGVIRNIDLSDFKVTTEEVDNVYLTEDELKKVYEVELDPLFCKIRDIFIVGCYTGLRYGDLYNLKPENINKEEGLIHPHQSKVHRSVVIPMIDYVPEILEKYNYQLPQIHLNTFNREIKTICKKAKINKEIVLVWKKG
ncbi:MAG: site-specific integrase, partial [Bacteroidales bacterium]